MFDGKNCINIALDFCLKLKGEQCKGKNKFLEYKIQFHAHNGSGFDTWIILKNLPCDQHIVHIIKNGRGNISFRVFSGYIYNGKKQIPQYLLFRCGMTPLNFSSKKIG